jgi:SAM-dependent methyltransferase
MKIQYTHKNNPFGYSPKGLVFEYLKKNQNNISNILDFGCRNGDFLAALNNENLFVNCLGVDLDSNIIDVAKKNNPNIDFQLITKNYKFPHIDGFFDTITLIGVVEHVYDQVGLLTEMARLTKKGGLIYIAVPGIHLFSFLDMGNFKFRFPKFHKFYCLFFMSKEEYQYKYVSNEFGCIGDIEAEKGWHEHFSRKSMEKLINNVKGLEIQTVDGLGFFYRILINLRYFLPSFSKKWIDKLILLDFKYFSVGELVFILNKN